MQCRRTPGGQHRHAPPPVHAEAQTVVQVALQGNQVPGRPGQPVQVPDAGAPRREVDALAGPEGQARHLLQGKPSLQGLHQFHQGPLTLPQDAEVDLGGVLQDEGSRGRGVLTAQDDRNPRKMQTHHSDQAPDLGPVLGEHATDADQVGLRLQALDDLFAGQSQGQHAPPEEGRHLEQGLADPVNDPRLVPCGPQAGGQVGGRQGRGQGPGVRPGRDQQWWADYRYAGHGRCGLRRSRP